MWKSLQVSSACTIRQGTTVPERLEGICAGDIGVQNKEGGVVFAQDITGERERTSYDDQNKSREISGWQH
jgi:hypothetical protein